jgi:hypothetical protein
MIAFWNWRVQLLNLCVSQRWVWLSQNDEMSMS